MRVVVTGASGRLGKVVVSTLLEAGLEVMGVDKVIPEQAGIAVREVDLCDLGQVFGALVGADAVIHLGAIPTGWGRPPEVVYRNNVLSQFNVFEAAACLHIPRVVSASSLSAFGFNDRQSPAEPLYLPLDEAHPLFPQNAYALSKEAGEGIAAAYCRRTGSSAASLRFPALIDEHNLTRIFQEEQQNTRVSAGELWSYVHVSDVARAFLLALQSPFEGYQVFHITSLDTTTRVPTDELLARWYPTVPRRGEKREGRWSLIDGTRANRILGYVPRFRWMDHLPE